MWNFLRELADYLLTRETEQELLERRIKEYGLTNAVEINHWIENDRRFSKR